MCSAQSAKTQTIICLLAWAIAEDPGPCMWVMAAQDEAKTFAKTRLMPSLEQCPLIKFPENRFDRTVLEINFPSMPLIINGANSKSKLQSKPIRWLFLDEVRNYPPGALEMVLKRTRAFWNARRVMISTPDLEDDAVHRSFLAGDQRHFYIECPKCKELQEMRWSTKRGDGTLAGMRWDDTPETHPTEGVWDFDKIAPTIRFECVKCDHQIKDQPQQRRELIMSGRWIPHNTLAPKDRVSFTWNAIIPLWVQWKDLVSEFLTANEATKVAALEPLKSFINETLGEPWRENVGSDVETKFGTYLKLQKWEDKYLDFMGVDMQKDCFYYAARSFSVDGKSRLIDEGKVLTFEELREKQIELGIGNRALGIDSGYETNLVYANCVKYGWTAFKGEDKEYFVHSINGKQRRRIYSERKKADPAIGTRGQGKMWANLFLWSNPKIKDLLSLLRRGHGPDFDVPGDVSEDYKAQIKNEVKKVKHNKETGRPEWKWVQIGKRPQHLFDCECMCLVHAVIARILYPEEEIPEKKEKEDVNVDT